MLAPVGLMLGRLVARFVATWGSPGAVALAATAEESVRGKEGAPAGGEAAAPPPSLLDGGWSWRLAVSDGVRRCRARCSHLWPGTAAGQQRLCLTSARSRPPIATRCPCCLFLRRFAKSVFAACLALGVGGGGLRGASVGWRVRRWSSRSWSGNACATRGGGRGRGAGWGSHGRGWLWREGPKVAAGEPRCGCTVGRSPRREGKDTAAAPPVWRHALTTGVMAQARHVEGPERALEVDKPRRARLLCRRVGSFSGELGGWQWEVLQRGSRRTRTRGKRGHPLMLRFIVETRGWLDLPGRGRPASGRAAFSFVLDRTKEEDSGSSLCDLHGLHRQAGAESD
eukprot:s6516_g1.t1